VRGGVARARRCLSLASKPGPDEVMLGEKSFQIFMGCANVTHFLSPLLLMKNPLRLERLERLELFERFKSFQTFNSFKPYSEHYTTLTSLIV
jgi:hypothetical protein